MAIPASGYFWALRSLIVVFLRSFKFGWYYCDVDSIEEL